MQTRKWQDQKGEDRYSTEVVLTGFKGELTLLDSRDGGDTKTVARQEAVYEDADSEIPF